MRFMDRILVLSLLFCIVEGKVKLPEGLHNVYTKEFYELMRLLQSNESGAKIYRKVVGAYDFTNFGHDIRKCPQRLRHIISDNMNCKKVAYKLESELLSVQIYSLMTTDEQYLESILKSKNCSQLSGESLELCDAFLSGRTNHGYRNSVVSDLNQEIDSCYIEERVNLSNNLTKRYF